MPSPQPVRSRPDPAILIVEDEGTLLLPVSKMLRNRGWCVLEASDGQAAVDVIRNCQTGIDVMLLDMTLPGMSSREVLEEAQRRRPDIKVIVTSAFGHGQVDSAFAGLPHQAFLRKPYRFQDLEDALATVLKAGVRAAPMDPFVY